MELQKRPCPSCGGTMTQGTRPETIALDGHALIYDQPGWHCAACNDGIIAGADNEAGDAALRNLKATQASHLKEILQAEYPRPITERNQH